jgi:hypothetical protein
MEIFRIIFAGVLTLCVLTPLRAELPVNLYAGTNLSVFYYNEPDQGISHSGSYFPGFVARINFDNPNYSKIYASARYKYLDGTYDYKGYVKNMAGIAHPYSDTALPQNKQNFEIIGGVFMGGIGTDILIKLMAGVEFENITDNAYTVNQYFYKRTRNSFYGAFGLSGRKDWGTNKSLEIAFFVKPAISSYQNSRFSDAGGIWATAPELRQRQIGGYRFDISATYKYERLWFEPYLSYTTISATKYDEFCMGKNCAISVKAQEPENQTMEFGINLGVWF